ncbi:ribosomal RNA-processing protein 8 isoform X2 [Narcine bancroftii]
MFEEEDWNDDIEAKALSDVIFHKPGSSHCSTKPGTLSKRRKQKLLQTLRALTAAGTSDKTLRQTQPDLEHSTVRRSQGRKRRHREQGQEEGVESQSAHDLELETEFGHMIKSRSEKGQRQAAEGNGLAHGQTAEGRLIHPQQVQAAGRLTRKQWRNRRKNQRRNRNKFRLAETRPARGRGAELLVGEGGSATGGYTAQEQAGNGEKGDSAETAALGTPTAKVNRRLKRKVSVPGGEGTGQRGCVTHNQPVPCTMGAGATAVGLDESLPDRSAALRARMQQRLTSARFRYINEQLYTSDSAAARMLFTQDVTAFQLYHQGFTAQLSQWPENPVDRIIAYIRNRPRSAIVADFGCGDCKVARSVANMVHSFDLVALNDHVTVCDMAKVPTRENAILDLLLGNKTEQVTEVPLSSESVDIVVFCLSLMGTNLLDILLEANRVLRVGGILKIAEVASRFGDVRRFVSVLGSLGFKLLSKDTENRYFYMFDFEKTQAPKDRNKLPQLMLKPCLYKKR